MALTNKQLKAIQWYKDSNPELRLQLSTPPNIYFKTPQNKVVPIHVTELVREYDQWNEGDKRQRARERKQAEKYT